MMARPTLKILFFAFVVVAGCVANPDESQSTNRSSLVVHNNRFPGPADADKRAGLPPPKPGTWIEKNGSLFCDGYLTNNEGIDFCSATMPSDWTSFTFNGLDYYYQRLAGQ